MQKPFELVCKRHGCQCVGCKKHSTTCCYFHGLRCPDSRDYDPEQKCPDRETKEEEECQDNTHC